jgi:endonuclease YncB( thermonuclease family)
MGSITKAVLLAALLLWLLFLPLLADTLTCRVISIDGGDILTILDAKFQQYKIRLVGIDAPESEQPFGARSQQHMSALAFGRSVIVDYDEKDRYVAGRWARSRSSAKM